MGLNEPLGRAQYLLQQCIFMCIHHATLNTVNPYISTSPQISTPFESMPLLLAKIKKTGKCLALDKPPPPLLCRVLTQQRLYSAGIGRI